jgi:hypothetical protein
VEKWSKDTLLCPFINFQKSKIKNSSLFPDTSYKKIHVLPNKGPNIVFEGDGQNEVEDGDEHNTSCKMTSVVLGEATRIISQRSNSDVINTKVNFGQMQEALKENETNLSKIEERMEVLLKKLSGEIRCHQKKLSEDINAFKKKVGK